MDQLTKNHTRVFTVYVKNENNLTLKYSLLDVTSSDSSSFSSNSNWHSIARDLNVNDCDENTLKNYPEARKKFCIPDKRKNQIYTTQYFTEARPRSGIVFTMTIFIEWGINFSLSPDRKYTLTVTSVCDRMNELYGEIHPL